jgi:hypothetical protein
MRDVAFACMRIWSTAEDFDDNTLHLLNKTRSRKTNHFDIAKGENISTIQVP